MRVTKTFRIDSKLWERALEFGRTQIPEQARNQVVEAAIKKYLERERDEGRSPFNLKKGNLIKQ